MNTLIKSIALFAAGAALAVSAQALADDDDIRRLAEARITLAEAIAIAEEQQGGQAYEAKLDDDSFSPEYEVDVAVEGVSYEVTVDAVSGEVLKVREDRDD